MPACTFCWITARFKELCHAGLQIRVRTRKSFSYFSTKTYVEGTQKNRLVNTVLLSTQNTCLNLCEDNYHKF